MQLWVVWYHRLIGETEGPALITDTACTATYRRFPSWHTDNYVDNRRVHDQTLWVSSSLNSVSLKPMANSLCLTFTTILSPLSFQ